jgi:hypothetical protein
MSLSRSRTKRVAKFDFIGIFVRWNVQLVEWNAEAYGPRRDNWNIDNGKSFICNLGIGL